MANRKKHANKEVEAAIAYAKAAGWEFVTVGKSAHAFGKLRCPVNNRNCRNGQFCSNSIWSTPRNPEAHAQKIRRWVDNCRYATGDESKDP